MLLTVHPCEHSISLVLISNCGSLIAVALLLSNKFLLKSEFNKIKSIVTDLNKLGYFCIYQNQKILVCNASLYLWFEQLHHSQENI